MTDYRLCFMSDDRTYRREPIHADDDATAIKEAEGRHPRLPAELWRGGSRIGVFEDSGSEPGDGADHARRHDDQPPARAAAAAVEPLGRAALWPAMRKLRRSSERESTGADEFS